MKKPSTTFWKDITPLPGEAKSEKLADIPKQLSMLEGQLNYLLNKAKKGKFENSAVNWAHLLVMETYYCVNQDGLSFYCADIEELNPYNLELEAFLEQGMVNEFGFNRELRLKFDW